MEFGFWDIIHIVGALAFFIYGMKMMSEGIQRAAGSQLRNILRSMTKNRYLGVFTGFLITAIVQSSSATTVMTVSFVNAGLLTLLESAGVMMGANIGTTITGWIVSELGFKLKLAHYSIPLFAFGVPMLFSKRGKLKYWGEFIIGFAILFLGLSYLKESVPNLKGNPEALTFLKDFATGGLGSRLIFVAIGTLVTIIVQSSSAAMAITLTMVSQGWLPLDVAAAMILGENIGTTITAEIASVVGNVHAKRSARIHSIFNIVGVIWMVLLLPVFMPILQNFFNFSSDTTTLAAFHTAFNLTNVILLIGFVPLLVKIAKQTVKSKGDEDEEIRLKFIDTVQKTPELATIEIHKEVARYGVLTAKMNEFTKKLINTTEPKKQAKMYKKLAKYEQITDNLEEEITEYITKLSNQEITPKTSLRFRSYLNICNDLERIGDIFFQIGKSIERKNEESIYFLPEQRNNLNEMLILVENAFVTMNQNLNSTSYDDVSINGANDNEKFINKFRDKLRKENLKNLGNKDYNTGSAMIYNNLFSALEKVGDHIVNVSEAVVGEI